MEAMLGETGEGSRDVGNSFDSVGVRFNGELNGDFDAVDMESSVRSNAITLKMVPNNCLQGDCSNISNSVSQVAKDVSENAEHLTSVCSDQLERHDKVPNSEPTFRDLVSEVPTSIGESVDSVGVVEEEEDEEGEEDEEEEEEEEEEDEEEETSNINSDMDRELPQESSKNCGSDSVTGSSINDDDISYKMVSGEGDLEPSDVCPSVLDNEKSKTVECDVGVGDECNNRASSNSEKDISMDGLNSPRSNESENQDNIGSECNNSVSGDGPDENNLNLEVDDDRLNQTDEEKKADSDNSVENVSNTNNTEGVSKCKSENCEVSSSNAELKNENEDQNQGEDAETKAEENSSKTKKSRKSAVVLNLTPRRSSRNLNKQKSYVEKEEDPDIQEITPSDPLADPLSTDSLRDDKENSKTRNARKNTIVVNDTKRLVEIATGSKGMKGGKKEPTLVIIDTNSILSGRGPVPVPQSSPPGPSSVAGSTSGYSVLPVAVPTPGLYPPIRLNTPFPTNSLPHPVAAMVPARPAPPPPPPQPPQILPTLTDDMYVVEAPSFIVPYVYEKPPIKPLKEYLEQLEIEIEETKSSNTIADEEKSSDLVQDSECGSVEPSKKQCEDEQCPVNGEETEKEVGDTKGESNVEERREKNTEVNDNESEGDGTNKQKTNSETKDENREDTSSQDCDKGGESRNTESTLSSSDGGIKNEMKLEETGKSSYFENPLGKFFMQIGINLVQEYVQTDLLRSQKRKREREGKKGMVATQFAINSLVKNLEFSKENNEPFHLEQKKCEYCSFKTESSLVMAQHLETPHMRNYVYRCNFCPLEFRNPHDILFHMEAEHNVRGRLERAPAFHQCPNCPFEDSQKGKLTRHMLSCAKKHKPERNQEPPPDWEPPAKIPRLARSRPTALGLGAAAYQAMAAKSVHPLLPKLVPGTVLPPAANINRGRGRPPIHGRYIPPDPKATRPIAPTQVRQNMIYRPGAATGQPQVLLPTAYQIAGSQIYQVVGSQGQVMPVVSSSVSSVPHLALMRPSSANSSVTTSVALVPNIATSNSTITIQSTSKNPTAKLLQQPSISITPLPRQPAGMAPGTSLHPKHMGHSGHPGHSPNKATFVICEICDGYIKDLEQLRNHMQWIHKVKIHPKMIYNRPPLNCQKCQFRFFTDQGLERHLLGSHGLVTSSMQEAANKGKDGGRCPVCGRVYQWKLLNHVARDHNMSLKPAHLSYKCTVCTATFGMYKQFENHVYSAHSVVAKRVIDKKSPQVPRPQASETLLKPLKINDEITIIPQPARPRPGPASRTGAVSAIMQQNMGPKRFKQRLQQKQSSVQVIELEDSPVKKDKASGGSGFQENGEDTLNAVKERLRRRKSLEISQVDSECTSQLSDDAPSKKRRRNDE